MKRVTDPAKPLTFRLASAADGAGRADAPLSNEAKIKAMIAETIEAADAITVPSSPLARKSSIDTFKTQAKDVALQARGLPVGRQLQAFTTIARKHRDAIARLTERSLNADHYLVKERAGKADIPAKYFLAFHQDAIREICADSELFELASMVRTKATRKPTIACLPPDELQQKLDALDQYAVAEHNRLNPRSPASQPKLPLPVAESKEDSDHDFDFDF